MGRRKGGGRGVVRMWGRKRGREEVQEVWTRFRRWSGGGQEVGWEGGGCGGEVGRGGISISSITCVTRDVIMKVHKCQLSFENEGEKGGHSAY